MPLTDRRDTNMLPNTKRAIELDYAKGIGIFWSFFAM